MKKTQNIYAENVKYGGINMTTRNTQYKICKYCDKKFKPNKKNPNQEYCKDICWKKSHNLK